MPRRKEHETDPSSPRDRHRRQRSRRHPARRGGEMSPRVIERAEHVVAELAANAALHGRVQGRDFLVALTLDGTAGTLRIAVSDTRGEYRPAIPPDRGPDDETGRGLLLVGALADRWGTDPRPPSGKTVCAEIDQHGERSEAISGQSGSQCR
ncbi:ATP-binding protein [Streptomyces sindenensis]|uniref:ATP-binding protein n=1 Tax=Streptomyces sindenensis TaxID=67363 RepID=A0ABW6ELE2_9ACTN